MILSNQIYSENFNLQYNIFDRGVKIDLILLTEITSTSQINGVYDKLFAYLPTVLKTECFNEKNLPFSVEVGETEIGHLFEHILLEYMSIYKEKSVKNFSIEGRTFWNALNLPVKQFTIDIYCSLTDFPIFVKSLKPTCNLVNTLIGDKFSLNYIPVSDITGNSVAFN